MSQMPPQGPPPMGPPQGPPMGGGPQYGPPPKKKGIVLLVLGLIALVVGGIITAVAVGGTASSVSGFQNIMEGNNTFIAPGETTMSLQADTYLIMSVDGGEYQGRTYNPTDAFPTNSTVFTVTGPNGQEVPVVSADAQVTGQSGSSSAEAVRQLTTPSAGDYTISVTNPDGMEERPILILSVQEMMNLGLGMLAGMGGLLCGAPLAVIGIILIVVWLIVRK